MTGTISIRLNIRGAGDDDYGIVRVEIPVSDIDWSLADRPRDDIDIDDIYQVDLQVGPGSDTWDRS
jgi:hypothetical protein